MSEHTEIEICGTVGIDGEKERRFYVIFDVDLDRKEPILILWANKKSNSHLLIFSLFAAMFLLGVLSIYI